MNKRKIALVLHLVAILLIVGCTNEPFGEVENTSKIEKESVVEIEAPLIELDTETLKNDSGKVMLKSLTLNKKGDAGHATVAIVSANGTVIIADPNGIPNEKGVIKADAITVSHGHSDHMDFNFIQPYLDLKVEGLVLLKVDEKKTVNEVHITGIAASHSEALEVQNPTDIIYLYEVNDVRIVHLGDVGQVELTSDQLEKIGEVDVLFSNFSNMTGYGFGTNKTLAIIKQLKPAIVLPLHYEPEVITEIQKELGITDISEEETLFVDKDDITNSTEMRYVFLK